jgi:hypothetical protein
LVLDIVQQLVGGLIFVRILDFWKLEDETAIFFRNIRDQLPPDAPSDHRRT